MIVAIAKLLKPFVVKYFYKITRKHIGKLGISTRPQKMIGREDIRIAKNAFKDSNNCQNKK